MLPTIYGIAKGVEMADPWEKKTDLKLIMCGSGSSLVVLESLFKYLSSRILFWTLSKNIEILWYIEVQVLKEQNNVIWVQRITMERQEKVR